MLFYIQFGKWYCLLGTWTLQDGGWRNDEQDNGASEGIDPESEPSDSRCEGPAASGSLLSPPSNPDGPKTCKSPDQATPGNVESTEELISRLNTMESDLDKIKRFCDFLEKVIVENGRTPLKDGGSGDEQQERISSALSRVQKVKLQIKDQQNLLNYFLYPPPPALQECDHLVTSDDFCNLSGNMVEILVAMMKLRDDTMEMVEPSMITEIHVFSQAL